MRGLDTLIKEAELIDSSPERVFAWLESHCKYSKSYEKALDKEAEKALLDRDEPLIDLALAKFGQHQETLTELFARATTVNTGQSREKAMRLAILGNQSINEAVFGRIPVCLFSSKSDGLLRWLPLASDDELHALFRNPRIDETFLRNFLECKGPWEALGDDARQLAIRTLSTNARMKIRYSGDMNGYAEFMHNTVFCSAWQLTTTLPATRRWADSLCGLLTVLPFEFHGLDDPLTVAERWRPAADDRVGLDEENKIAKYGLAGGYAVVRRSLACLSPKKKQETRESLLESKDAAYRDAVYTYFEMTADQILAAYAIDKKLAVNSCQQNLRIWRNPESRKALQDISWKACRELDNNYMDSANDYNYFEAENKKLYPAWFKEEDVEDEDEGEVEIDESTLPATRAEIETLNERLSGIEDQIRESMTISAQMSQLAVTIKAQLRWVWWFALGALVASLWHR